MANSVFALGGASAQVDAPYFWLVKLCMHLSLRTVYAFGYRTHGIQGALSSCPHRRLKSKRNSMSDLLIVLCCGFVDESVSRAR